MSEPPPSSFTQAWHQVWQRIGMKANKLDWRQPIGQVRQNFLAFSRAIEPDPPPLADVRDIPVTRSAAIGSGILRVRLYTPLAAGIAPGPGVVWYHGGGFMVGDLESHDMVCRRLADASRCRILSVDYRLAPENKFPAAVDDALLGYRWALENFAVTGMDPTRLAVAGDSAGGNLAAVVCHEMLRVGDTAPVFQLLIYPLVQLADLGPERLDMQEGLFLSAGTLEVIRRAYVPEGVDPTNPLLSPLFNTDFSRLPPAHVITCGWDPLRDEGKAYADKLAAHGVRVTVRDYPEQVHGFFNLTALSARAREAVAAAGIVLASAMQR
jgi:acetyl esterase